MPRQPPFPARVVRYPEQLKLGRLLAQIFPRCNNLVAARIMGVTKGNAAMMLHGHAWLSRERALRLAEHLRLFQLALPQIVALSERERTNLKRQIDPVSGRFRDTRISRGKIRPQKAPESGEES